MQASKNCVEQIISGGSGLIFKGSGFYNTDYKTQVLRRVGRVRPVQED